MQPRQLISLLIGIVLIAAVAGFGLLRAFDRAHTLNATTAIIESDTSSVGTAFAGSIASVSVAPGDTVSAGQELFRIQSPTLQQARNTSRFDSDGVGYRMEGEDTQIFLATGSGTIGAMPYGVGSFVPANTEITTVTLHNTLRVRGELGLDAADYGRMPLGTPVEITLPTRDKITAKIYDVTFQKGENGANAVVRARSDELSEQNHLLNGSPVEARVQLEPTEGVGVWTVRQVGELFRPRGY